MVDRNWHNQLHRELARQRLPRQYAERLMDELLDHALCLKEETFTMDATKSKPVAESATERIGEPRQLAQAAGEEYRRRTWLGRHPIVTFLIAPAPTLVLTYLLSILGLVLAGKALEAVGGETRGLTKADVSPAMLAVMEGGFYLWAAAPFLITTGLICWAARRTSRGPKWTLAACLIVTAVAASYYSTTRLPTEPGNGQLMTGLGFPPWHAVAPAPESDAISFATNGHPVGRWVLPLLPLTVCGLFLWRNSRNDRLPPPLPRAAQISVSNS